MYWTSLMLTTIHIVMLTNLLINFHSLQIYHDMIYMLGVKHCSMTNDDYMLPMVTYHLDITGDASETDFAA